MLAPRTQLTEDRFEGFELVSRFFAYSDNYSDGFSTYTGNVTEYIDKYVENQNVLCAKDETIIDDYRNRFIRMLNYAEDILGTRGFRKSMSSKSTPRARFEALSIGIDAAFAAKPDLQYKDISDWIDGEEFSKWTRSDAANNKNKLTGRIDFVKNKLIEEE